MTPSQRSHVTNGGPGDPDKPLTAEERLFVDAISAGLSGDAARMAQALRQSLTRSRRLWSAELGPLRNALLVAAASAVPPLPDDKPTARRDLLTGWQPRQRLEGLRFPVPGDSDESSSAPAITVDDLPDGLEFDDQPPNAPALPAAARESLTAIAAEYRSDRLAARGLSPTRTLLLTGPPGTGKTMTARWLAWKLNRQLLVLNLANTMSNELGRSAHNLSAALEAAERSGSVLFLDEFDAIASHRGSDNDVGEMRRLVNVLLMRLDRWRAGSLLIAATNHPELLDRAVRRRFEVHLDLPLPDASTRELILRELAPELHATQRDALAAATSGFSGSDLATAAIRAARRAALSDRDLSLPDLLREIAHDGKLPKAARDRLIRTFSQAGLSQRKIGELVGVSHVSVGKVIKQPHDDQ
jgi:hypothetical protein